MSAAVHVLPRAGRDPMGELRSAIVEGRLNAEQAGALDALLATLTAAPAIEPGPRLAAVGLSNEEVIERYLRAGAARGWQPSTTRVRTLQLRRIAGQLPVPLVEVTEEQLLDWRESLPGKPETIASYTSAVSGLYRWMTVKARPRVRLDDPALVLDRPRVPQALPRPIHSDQYDLALACAVTQPAMYVWLGLMGCSGLRCCEVAWLRVEDIEDLDDGSGLLHVLGKGAKRRTVPAGPHLMTVLQVFTRGRVIGPVFTRPSDGFAHTPNAVSTQVAKFLAELRIPATAHQLRHRWASDYHALDPDLYRQAKLMGHASVDTTQRYTEVSPTEAIGFIRELTARRMGRTGGRR